MTGGDRLPSEPGMELVGELDPQTGIFYPVTPNSAGEYRVLCLYFTHLRRTVPVSVARSLCAFFIKRRGGDADYRFGSFLNSDGIMKVTSQDLRNKLCNNPSMILLCNDACGRR